MRSRGAGKHLDRRGATDDQRLAGGHVVDCDPHRDALREADPAECRIDVGEQVRAGAAIAILDPPGDALDVTGDDAVFPINRTWTGSPTWIRGSFVSSK